MSNFEIPSHITVTGSKPTNSVADGQGLSHASGNLKVNLNSEDAPLTDEMEQVDVALAANYNRMVSILRSYLALAENPSDLTDESFRKTIFSGLSYGLRKSGEFLGQARYWQTCAVAERKRAEAIAALDEFSDYAQRRKDEGKEIKSTDKTVGYYIHIDSGVQKAIQKEAMLDAIVEQLSTMKQEFVMAISTIKALIYGTKDSDFMSGRD